MDHSNLVFISCFDVQFLRFLFEHHKSHKKGGVNYKLELKYKKSSKYEEGMVRKQKKNSSNFFHKYKKFFFFNFLLKNY
jgi:hypothetical protein